MSWSADVVVHTTDQHGREYAHRYEVVNSHTYNLTPMWCHVGVIEERTSELDGRTCADLQPVLLAALAKAWSDEDTLYALSPPNGWGTVEGFMRVLLAFAKVVHEHPAGVIAWRG